MWLESADPNTVLELGLHNGGAEKPWLVNLRRLPRGCPRIPCKQGQRLAHNPCKDCETRAASQVPNRPVGQRNSSGYR
jgi:hypothetical protein